MHRITVRTAAGRAVRVVAGLEGILAPVCALALLLHPTPLTWPALVLGALPSVGRWATTGRPWRATPFDLGLVLLAIGTLIGMLVTLDPAGGAIRLAGLAAALILFAWAREHALSERAAYHAAIGVLIIVTVGAVLLLHVAAPFLRLERAPPLAALASTLEPLGLYRVLVADEAALQRFRLYASGVGAVAAVGLAMAAGLGLAAPSRRSLLPLGIGSLGFAVLLLVADNRGSMIAAALALGGVVVWWRPGLALVAGLVVFGTLDLIALGVQRGLDLRTVVERLDFWQKGLLLAGETPYTGVGLGLGSVQLAYRAAFQPAYPPFSHAHNIFVQVLLEQGILGLLGLVSMTIALLRLGGVPAEAEAARSRENSPAAWSRAASLAAFGGALALLAAGLTEIVGLTTLGGALLFGLLGLLVASHDAGAARQRSEAPDPVRALPSAQPMQAFGMRGSPDHVGRVSTRAGHDLFDRAPGRALGSMASFLERPGIWLRAVRRDAARSGRRRLTVAVGALVALGVLALTGLARPLAASLPLNAGTTALYRATLPESAGRDDQARALGGAVPALRLAERIDPEGVTIRRNLSLALAAHGDRVEARRLADDARARTRPDDVNGLFGAGRAYAAAGAYDDAIELWSTVGAGPQLMGLGRQLAGGRSWETGVSACVAAARVGAPARSAADAIGRASLAHGESTDAAIARLAPLLADGGRLAYAAKLQAARLYRLDGQLMAAEQALSEAESLGSDAQLALERGLLLVWHGQLSEAVAPLRWAVDHQIEPPDPVPDGDDPHYWLAFVQASLGRHTEAVAAARAGLAVLPEEQASLRLPYQLLLGESLLAAGQPDEALATFRAAGRLAPADPRVEDGITRARAARR